jgi:nucleoside-diphosphate-sugar epimerase
MTDETHPARTPAAPAGGAAGKTVLLAGATGVLGRHIDRALTAAGHRVLSVGRSAGNELRADLLDREALLRAVDGRHADAVVHAATALRRPPARHSDMAATNLLRTRGTKNLLAAAREVGAGRFVSESMVFGYGYGDFGPEPVTESGTPFGPPGANPALERTLDGLRTKEELTLGADGLDGVALRFGLFYGPGGTETLVRMLRRRALPVTPERGLVLPWVELSDAAAAVALAVDRGRAGAAYNIADDTPLGFGAHVRLTADIFGTPQPMTLPLWAVRPLGYLHAMLTTNVRMDTALAAAELGWRPAHPGAREGLGALAKARQADGAHRVA